MRFGYIGILVLFGFSLIGQVTVVHQDFNLKGIRCKSVTYELERPLFSFISNDHYYESNHPGHQLNIQWIDSIKKYDIVLTNISDDTLVIKNIIPFDVRRDHVYITGLGDHTLSRTHLYIPGRGPVNVIVPDNAWNLGYASLLVNDSIQLYALTRRKSWSHAERKRFETILLPGGSVTYDFYLDTFSGVWQDGMRKCFQQFKLYDLDTFNETLYHRPDLQWIKQAKDDPPDDDMGSKII
jgi:hypothetical protein